jgi:serine/threonine-protein kinase RsbW
MRVNLDFSSHQQYNYTERDTAMKTTEITLASKLENIGLIERDVRHALSSLTTDDEFVNDIMICIDEAFSNIVFHGYKNREDGDITVIVRTNRKSAEIEFIDHAEAFLPDTRRPVLGKALMKKTNLGLGIFLMRELMDEVRYERASGTNRLTMIKKIY